MIDAISDMLTRIRNAHAAGHATVLVPKSKLKLAVATVFAKEGFVENVDVVCDETTAGREMIRITLKYEQVSATRRRPGIEGLRQVSRQGQRRYVKKTDLHQVRSGYGLAVVSTSQGVMSGKEARKRGLGGELICELW